MNARQWLLTAAALSMPLAEAQMTPPATARLAAQLPALEALPADPAGQPAPAALSFAQFIQLTEQSNRDLAAQRLNVPIAEQAVLIARAPPNPSLSLAGDRDLSFHNRYATGTDGQRALLRQVESRSVGLSQTLELGGKRAARTRVARAGVDLAQASLADYLRSLRSAAANAFIAALKAEQVLAVKRHSTEALERVVEINEEKRRHGAASDLVVEQVQVELARARNELTTADAERASAAADLLSYVGDAWSGNAAPRLTGSLRTPLRDYPHDQAIDTALDNRPDILAAQQALTVAERQLELARASRIPDVDIAVTYGYNGSVALNHPVDPTPAFRQLGLSLSVPLPLFSQGQHELRQAQMAVEQARLNLDSAKRTARIEVIQALAAYNAAGEQLSRFDAGILDNAQKVLTATLYSYERGGASLLELLEARRVDAETQLEYLDVLAGLASAWVQVEQSMAVWDIRF